MRTVHADRMGLQREKRHRSLLESEVVVIDAFTAEEVAVSHETRPHVPNDELFKAEHAIPDGSAANPHEYRIVPWMIAGLALFGLVVVGVSMFVVGGFPAMGMGLAWVIVGYAAAWSVVWMAGLIRTQEESEIERELWKHRPHDANRRA